MNYEPFCILGPNSLVIYFKSKSQKMKMLIISLISLSLLSCNNVEDAELEGTTWKVTSFKNENGNRTSVGISCTMTLTDGNANIALDVNSCFGTYTLGNNGQIDFSDGFGCTEACCDEPESEEAMRMITKCTEYNISGNTLELSNAEGEVLKLKKE
jgi:hypothetical protein